MCKDCKYCYVAKVCGVEFCDVAIKPTKDKPYDGTRLAFQPKEYKRKVDYGVLT